MSIKFGDFGQNAIFLNLAIRVNFFFGCTFDLVLGNLSTTHAQLRMTCHNVYSGGLSADGI